MGESTEIKKVGKRKVHRPNTVCRQMTIEGIPHGDYIAKCPTCKTILKGTRRWIKKQIAMCIKRDEYGIK